MHEVSGKLRDHYEATFRKHGATSAGVDWGVDQAKLELRYRKMLDLVAPARAGRVSLLDVGCGYGGLFPFATAQGIDLDYTGIDVAGSMIAWARDHHASGSARFLVGDVLELDPQTESFDYVVCNGILTQKLDTPGGAMDEFAQHLIRHMFALCRRGIAFNIMTTKVNFFANNLYYRNPSEMLAWTLSELSPHVRLDHGYPLYEYTTYVLKEPV